MKTKNLTTISLFSILCMSFFFYASNCNQKEESITLAWEPPAFYAISPEDCTPSSSLIEDEIINSMLYTVRYKIKEDIDWTTLDSIIGTMISLTLPAGFTYEVQVKAAGSPCFSESIEFVLPSSSSE